MAADMPHAQQRIRDVHRLLQDLAHSPYPDLKSPQNMQKRASVALVIRIKPSYSCWPPSTISTPKTTSLDEFFAQEWVQHGNAEVLFIKRASRKGDRWTSHIALPGGKRDPMDSSDQAAAIRESLEEVGLDLEQYAFYCGNLPQRLVTTHWGKRPLLVLCPYVFLLTTHHLPPLKLQPTEVAATHWVSIQHLQSCTARTIAFEDVSSRLANQETGVKKWMLSLILGKMTFAAISLLPSESLHSTSSLEPQESCPARPTVQSRLRNVGTRIYRSDLFNQYPRSPAESPLLLWGLTLGVLSDFLDLIPPHNALELWCYPNFTPLDVRFTVWLMTYRFKQRKRVELQAGSEIPLYNNPTFGTASESVAYSSPSSSTVLVDRPDETGFHGLGTGNSTPSAFSEARSRKKKAAVSTMLDGFVDRIAQYLLPTITDRARYYDIVRRAVAVALAGRATFAVLLLVLAWRRSGAHRRVLV